MIRDASDSNWTLDQATEVGRRILAALGTPDRPLRAVDEKLQTGKVPRVAIEQAARRGAGLDHIAQGIEQAYFHLGRVGRKNREVGAVAIPMRAQRIRQAFLC